MSRNQVGSDAKKVHLGAAINNSLSGIARTISPTPSLKLTRLRFEKHYIRK